MRVRVVRVSEQIAKCAMSPHTNLVVTYSESCGSNSTRPKYGLFVWDRFDWLCPCWMFTWLPWGGVPNLLGQESDTVLPFAPVPGCPMTVRLCPVLSHAVP